MLILFIISTVGTMHIMLLNSVWNNE